MKSDDGDNEYRFWNDSWKSNLDIFIGTIHSISWNI